MGQGVKKRFIISRKKKNCEEASKIMQVVKKIDTSENRTFFSFYSSLEKKITVNIFKWCGLS